jgi:hypothetical protein
MKLPLITIIDTELNRGTYMGKQPVGLDDFCLRITEEYKRYGADVYTIPRDYYSSWVARRGDSLPMGWVTFQDKNVTITRIIRKKSGCTPCPPII